MKKRKRPEGGSRGASPRTHGPGGAARPAHAVEIAPVARAADREHQAGEAVLSNRVFLAAMVLAACAGVLLRLAFVQGQILLDDEWHALEYAAGNSAWFLLTHFAIPGATSIPLNLYAWALLHTVGWNETLLRLPSLVPGILSLFVLPWLVRQAVDRLTVVVFAWLLAISPFLVFYSRIARPYEMVALTATAAALHAYLWLATGRRAHALAYIGYGIAAAYFHQLAIVSVAVPGVAALLVKVVPARASSAPQRIRPSIGGMAAVTVACAAGCAVALGPAFVQSGGAAASSVVGSGGMTAHTAEGFASMLAGTSNVWLVVLFWALLLVGLASLWGQKRILAALLVAEAALYGIVLAVTRPTLVETPLVFSRYVVALFPLGLLSVAAGVVRVQRFVEGLTRQGAGAVWAHRLPALGGAGFAALLFVLGPLPHVYYRPNNFTGHSAFLESFAPPDWERSYRSEMMPDGPAIAGAGALSAFYRQLASDTRASSIIEFPMFVGNHFNLYYYSQHVHRKRVLAGYFPRFRLDGVPSRGRVEGSDYVDLVMSRARDVGRSNMSNMVDVSDPDAVRASGAAYLVLHKHLPTELMSPPSGAPPRDYPPVQYLAKGYAQRLGQPVFEDADLVVFAVHP